MQWASVALTAIAVVLIFKLNWPALRTLFVLAALGMLIQIPSVM